MVNYNNRNRKLRNNQSFFKLRGLSSNSKFTVSPNEFTELRNFYHQTTFKLKSREGVRYAYSDKNLGFVGDSVEYIDSGGNANLVYVRGQRLVKYDGVSTSYATFGGSELIFDSTKTQQLAVAKDHVYIVENTEYLWKFDGSNLERLTVPSTATYGNNTSVCEFGGKLWLLTSNSYVRFSATGSDTVWEDRVLLVGTVSASGTTVTGSNTIFNQTQIEVGAKILISDGTNEEYAYVSDVGSNTSITLNESLTNTFGAGSNIFLIGLEFQTPLDEGDGMLPKSIVPFGQYLGVSKSSDDLSSSKSKLYVLKPNPLEESPQLLIQIQEISGTFDLHPYSLCEYNDSLLYVSAQSLFSLTPSSEDISSVRPYNLSEGKLNNKLESISRNKRIYTRVKALRNENIDVIQIALPTSDNKNYNDLLLIGFDYKDNPSLPFNFEFGEFLIPTQFNVNDILDIDTEFSFISTLQGNFYLISNPHNYQLFIPTQTYDQIATSYGLTTWDSTLEFRFDQDNTVRADNALGYATDFENYPIDRLLETGSISNELQNRLDIEKTTLIMAESQANLSIFPYDFYNIQHIIDGKDTGFSIERQYSGSELIVYTADLTTISADSTLYTADNAYTNISDISPIEYWTRQKRFRTLQLRIRDRLSSALLEFDGYSISYTLSRYT